MRPVSLGLRAFGSYAGELHIDLTRLARHGIFAISGPTGAGKSTIFDALVYALYDDLPGFRVDGNVRSQFADPATPTWVSLDFVVHGERWRVERRPTQLVHRRHAGAAPPVGSAPTERKSTVVLGRVGDDGELLPGTAVTRKGDVKRRIDALVGLTKEQFEQVVLIPQGRFEEVLKADTSKRAPLLRRLFPVELFTRVTETLRSIAAARQAELQEATRVRDDVLERLRAAYGTAVAQLPDDVRAAVLGPDGPIELDAGVLAHGIAAIDDALRRVDAIVDARSEEAELARTRLEDARRAAAAWDRWQEDLAFAASFDDEERRDAEELALLVRGRRLADLRVPLFEWEEATRRLRVLDEELAGLCESIGSERPGETPAGVGAPASGVLADLHESGALADSHGAGVIAERLAAEARHLEDEIGRFERLVETGAVLASRRAAVETRGTELAERALKLEAEEQAVALVIEEIQRLRVETASVDALAAAVSALEREQQVASRSASAVAELERLEAELDWASSAAARAAALADSVRISWRDGLAGRLAQLLSDGEPCPTCGAFEHPTPAEWREDGADDEALAAADRARGEALEVRSAAERRAASVRGVVGALAETRPLEDVEDDLTARRAEFATVRDSADRLAAVVAEEGRRSPALLRAREQLDTEHLALGADRAGLVAEEDQHRRSVEAFVEDHGALESPAALAAARRALAADVADLAALLRERETVEASLRSRAAVVEPVAIELGASGPDALLSWLVEPAELEERSLASEARRCCREEVRRRIAEHEALLGVGDGANAESRPDVESFEAAAGAAAAAHVSLVERRGVLADRAAVLSAGPAQIGEAERALAAARLALEQAKTLADCCAGLGGGPATTASATLRLSLENWVLADYLRQVLVQANHRLDAMTAGRFALELNEGVTDGRKPWGLDLAVFDANTGQVRPATTLSGGETFMAALALALGLADVVSGGSNREVGALFVDEGFGSLDLQSLDAVIDVLRSLEDGGRIVCVVSHVRELEHALPSGVTVQPSPHGSVATVHYPDDVAERPSR